MNTRKKPMRQEGNTPDWMDKMLQSVSDELDNNQGTIDDEDKLVRLMIDMIYERRVRKIDELEERKEALKNEADTILSEIHRLQLLDSEFWKDLIESGELPQKSQN